MATSGLENGSSVNNNISFQSQKSSTSTATPSSLVSINSTPKSSNINLTNDDESEDIDEDFDIDEAVDGDHSSSDDADADDDGFKRVVRAHAAPRAPKRVSFRFKMDTGLYALVKAKTRPTSIAFDPAGERFVVSATDAHVRVFSLRSGALSHEYDESLAASAAAQARASGGAGDVGAGAMEEMDWSKRSAVERELLALQEKHTFPPRAQCSNALFDCSGAFVLFSTLTGVKVCVFIYRYILNEFCSRF